MSLFSAPEDWPESIPFGHMAHHLLDDSVEGAILVADGNLVQLELSSAQLSEVLRGLWHLKQEKNNRTKAMPLQRKPGGATRIFQFQSMTKNIESILHA